MAYQICWKAFFKRNLFTLRHPAAFSGLLCNYLANLDMWNCIFFVNISSTSQDGNEMFC